MKIRNIYEKYNTPESLVTHMLRVGSLTHIIVDNWHGVDINKKATVIAALLHDLAKPITFKPEKQADFGMTPEQIESLKLFQKKIMAKYGNYEYDVLKKMIEELECNPTITKVVANTEWKDIPRILKEGLAQLTKYK